MRVVVDAYLASGRPVGSKELAGMAEIAWKPSTVRAELAALEAAGYLTHPHTSAGRLPTDAGYRRYVDLLLESGETSRQTGVALELSRLRAEVDEAMRETTAALAQVTDLVALATAPPETVAATIHRVEVLRLRPNRVMVIAIASSGAIAKRVFDFDTSVDPGLVEWASSYLNESLSGMSLGARMIGDRLADPALEPLESEFIGALGSVFTELDRGAGEMLYMEGTARLLSDSRLARPAGRRPADERAGEQGGDAQGAALGTRRALRVPLDRRREPAAGAALGQRRRRELWARAPQSRLGRGGRAAADGLRDGDRIRSRRRPRAVQLLRDGLRRLSD